MAERLAKKVLLIGWDSADWNMINPLLDAGQMPALEGLVNNGVVGNLSSMWPMLSPLLWTSIATGKRPFKHGITHFVEPDRQASTGLRSIRATQRRCKALWNILTQSGLRSNVVGWYATHPAEPVSGVIVSDYYRNRPSLTAGSTWPMAKGTVHPERLSELLSGLRVHPVELEAAHLLPFIPQAAQIDQQNDERLLALAKTLAECASVHNAATWLMENEPWDFTAVFYPTLDQLGHDFMCYHPPRMEDIPEADFELFKDVMNGAYRYHDMMLHRLLQLAGEDTTVIICSDHGFHCGDKRPKDFLKSPDEQSALSELWHRHYGVICAQGPAIKKDDRVYGASVLDLTPLILTLFGLPCGADMDGNVPKVFERAIEPEKIPSWENVPGESGQLGPGAAGVDSSSDADDSEEAIRQLVALGYLDPMSNDKEATIAKAGLEAKFHFACSYAESEQCDKAVEILEELCREAPGKQEYLIPLARYNLTLGRLEDCQRTLQQVGTDPTCLTPFGRFVAGLLSKAQGDIGKALEHFEAALPGEHQSVELFWSMGAAYSELGRWSEANNAFQHAVELDPENASAHSGLAVVRLAQGRNEDAAEHSLRAIGLLHHFPDGHYQLGIALARMGMVQRAIQALEVCLSMQPSARMAAAAHELLAELQQRGIGDPEKAAEHRELAGKFAAQAPARGNSLATDVAAAGVQP